MSKSLYFVFVSKSGMDVGLSEYEITKETGKRYYIGNGRVLIGYGYVRLYPSFIDKRHSRVFVCLTDALTCFSHEITESRKRLSEREGELYTSYKRAKQMKAALAGGK